MTTATYGMLATFDMDLDREEEQRAGLEQAVLPAAQQAPGFVSGTWTLDRRLCQSTVLVLFGTAESAQAYAEFVHQDAPQQEALGISLRDIRVVEVTAAV